MNTSEEVEKVIKKPLKLRLAEGIGKNVAYGTVFNAMTNLKKIENDMPSTGKLGSAPMGSVGEALLSLMMVPATLAAFEGYKALKNSLYPNTEQGFKNMIEEVPELKDEMDLKEAYRRYVAFHKLSPSLASHPMVAASFVKATAAGGGIDPGFAQSLIENTEMANREPITPVISDVFKRMPGAFTSKQLKKSGAITLSELDKKLKQLSKIQKKPLLENQKVIKNHDLEKEVENLLKNGPSIPGKRLLDNQRVSEVGRLSTRTGKKILSRAFKIKKLLGLK